MSSERSERVETSGDVAISWYRCHCEERHDEALCSFGVAVLSKYYTSVFSKGELRYHPLVGLLCFVRKETTNKNRR